MQDETLILKPLKEPKELVWRFATALHVEEEKNKIDYENMLINLERADHNLTTKNNKIRKYKDLSFKWKKSINQMKEKTKEETLAKIQQRSESLRRKGSVVFKLLRSKNEEKGKASQENLLRIQKSLDQTKLKNMRRAESIELIRQQTDQEIQGRLTKFSELKKKNMDEIQTKFMTRSSSSLEHYRIHSTFMTEKLIEDRKHMEEKKFDKFSKFYKHFKEIQREKSKKKGKENEKKQNKEEILEELERERKRVADSVIKNLKEMEKRREDLKKNMTLKTEEKVNQFRETCRLHSDKKESLFWNREVKNQNLLSKQFTQMFNQTWKEEKLHKKNNVYKKAILEQVEIESQISEFYKRLEDIKKKSVLKLSSEQQKEIYNKLKREKEEAKRKLEEEEKEKNK